MKHKEGKVLCSGTDSFNNHLLHIACKNGNFKVLKVCHLVCVCVCLSVCLSVCTV